MMGCTLQGKRGLNSQIKDFKLVLLHVQHNGSSFLLVEFQTRVILNPIRHSFSKADSRKWETSA